MRVATLYAGPISRITGTSERILQIARGLASLGVQVKLLGVVRNKDRAMVRASGPANLKVVSIPERILSSPMFLMWAPRLVADGLTHKYDVLQLESFSFSRSLALFFLLRPFGRKFIVVFHDKRFKQDPRRKIVGRLRLFLQKMVLRLFDTTITPGVSVKNFFEELHGQLAHERIVVIPNGAPHIITKERTDSSGSREKFGIDRNAFVLLFFGSMDFKPNYESAFRLYKFSNYLSKRYERISGRSLIFVVAGLGSEVLPKTPHFVPIGFVDKLNDLLSLPDAIVLPHGPSYSGPHVKTMYAFLSRKPVIATEDSVKDMPHVAPGKHFLPFVIDSPRSLLNALTKLNRDKDLGLVLAGNAYLYARRLSWRHVSSLHLRLYESILQK